MNLTVRQRSVVLPVISIGSVTGSILLWQLACAQGWISPLVLPSPLDIVTTTIDLIEDGYRTSPLWLHIAVSLGRALAAFIAAILIGVPLGLVMGLSPSLNAALNPFVQFLRPIPKIALVPLAVVWLGIGEASKFFLIFVSTFLSVVVGAVSAAHDVNRDLVRAAQTLGVSRRQLLFHVILPDALPQIFTTVRLSIGIGWTALIAAEMIAADSGIGWMVLNASGYLRTDIVMLGILLLGGIGFILDALVVKAQKILVPWAGRA